MTVILCASDFDQLGGDARGAFACVDEMHAGWQPYAGRWRCVTDIADERVGD